MRLPPTSKLPPKAQLQITEIFIRLHLLPYTVGTWILRLFGRKIGPPETTAVVDLEGLGKRRISGTFREIADELDRLGRIQHEALHKGPD